MGWKSSLRISLLERLESPTYLLGVKKIMSESRCGRTHTTSDPVADAIHPRFDSVDDFCNELLEKDAYVLDFKDKLSFEQWQGFCDELPRLAAAWNTSDDGSLVFELTYLQTVARKRGSAAHSG